MVSQRLLFLERLKPLPTSLAPPLHKESSWTTSQEYVVGQTENLTFHRHPTSYPSYFYTDAHRIMLLIADNLSCLLDPLARHASRVPSLLPTRLQTALP